jgi:hypothetical protein
MLSLLVVLLIAWNLSNTKVFLCSLRIQLRKSFDDALSAKVVVTASHPHLLADGEKLPGIGLIELKFRRWKLLESLQNHIDNLEKVMDVFRQHSNFFIIAGLQGAWNPIRYWCCNEDNKANSVMFVR